MAIAGAFRKTRENASGNLSFVSSGFVKRLLLRGLQEQTLKPGAHEDLLYDESRTREILLNGKGAREA
jgi:hypothetical protein